MGQVDRSKRAYWQSRHKWRSGRPLPPPSRPSEEDIRGYEECAAALSQAMGARSLRVLLLGVTRSIAAMRWPAGSSVVAMDWADAMLRLGLPGGDSASPVLADWREMPLAGRCRDLVIGDGCYASLDSFEDCVALNAEVARVLRPGGHFVQRCFVRPANPEPIDRILDDARSGRAGSIEQFRWRLAMALHPSGGRAVAAQDVWRAWREIVPEPAGLAAAAGWSDGDLELLERWQGEDVRVPLPTLAEIKALAAEGFEFLDCRLPYYPMGNCFPIVVLRARR